MDGSGKKGSAGFWSIEFYQPYFDIDTITVLQRCYHTLLPFSPSYRSTFSGGLDLYGSFWVPTTLILALFMSSSLAASIASYLSAPGAEYDYDFALLGLATAIVYAYAFGLPIGLWLVLRYMGVGEWGIVDALGIWGYGLFVWIPVSVSTIVSSGLLPTETRPFYLADIVRDTQLDCSLGPCWSCVRSVGLFPRGACLPTPGEREYSSSPIPEFFFYPLTTDGAPAYRPTLKPRVFSSL